MQEATLYIGGFIAASWTGLVLFIAVKCFTISIEQSRSEKMLLARKHRN